MNYKACLGVSLCGELHRRHVLTMSQKALKDRGIDQMLDEARADNKEHDVEYLGAKAKCTHISSATPKVATLPLTLRRIQWRCIFQHSGGVTAQEAFTAHR